MTYTPPVDPDPREAKLPRWARDLLSNMRLRVERAERTAEAARLATKPDETDTVLYRYGDEEVGLAPGSTVQFRIGSNRRDYVGCRIHRDSRGARLDLIGGDSIRITPHSSNHISIIVEI